MFPHPILFVALTIFWMLLSNQFTLGTFLIGCIVATGACRAMAALRPAKPRLRNVHLIPGFVATVFWDIMRSNYEVASLIIRGRKEGHVSAFITVPLEMKHPLGLAILAIILTSTPGAAWLEYDQRVGTLLMHVLDVRDEDEWREMVKSRYEAKLLAILGN